MAERKPDKDGIIRYTVGGTKVMIFPPLSKEELATCEATNAQLAWLRSGKRRPC